MINLAWTIALMLTVAVSVRSKALFNHLSFHIHRGFLEISVFVIINIVGSIKTQKKLRFVFINIAGSIFIF